jgi:hypothetical protein
MSSTIYNYFVILIVPPRPPAHIRTSLDRTPESSLFQQSHLRPDMRRAPRRPAFGERVPARALDLAPAPAESVAPGSTVGAAVAARVGWPLGHWGGEEGEEGDRENFASFLLRFTACLPACKYATP